MVFVLFYIMFGSAAFAQNLDSLDWEKAGDGAYEGVFERGTRQWSRLKTEVTATLKPGVSVYSMPEYMNSKNLNWMPWNNWPLRCERSAAQAPLKGRLMFVSGDVAAVRLDADDNFCGSSFNSEHQDRKLVFVRRGDVAGVAPRSDEDAATEAGFEGPCDENCRNAIGVLKDMTEKARTAPVGPEKSKEEMEKYIRCWSTPHQQNYDRDYKKLIELAGSTFAVNYFPNENDAIRSISEGQDTDTQKGSPFLVMARTNNMKCIALIESEWDPSKTSRTGAMGLGQQTKENIEHMTCLLEGCRAKITRPVFQNGKQVIDPATGKAKQETVTVDKKPAKWAADLWERYHERVRKSVSRAEYARLTTNPVTGQPCRPTMKLKELDAPCPINSIAAMALYQIVAEVQIRSETSLYKNDKQNRDFNPEERFHVNLVQSATNNAGTGTTQKAVKGQTNTAAMVNSLAGHAGSADRQTEVGDYVKNLRNCMQSGNFKPYRKLGKKEEARDCSKVSGR